jgi:hypothetical protein
MLDRSSTLMVLGQTVSRGLDENDFSRVEVLAFAYSLASLR